jgi:hypothetical protein
MLLIVILVSILAGFGAGYATRAWGYRERMGRNPPRRPYSSSAFRQSNSLAKARRAF